MSSSPKPTELQSHGKHEVATSSTVETSKEKTHVTSTQDVDKIEKELHKVGLHWFSILIEGESRKGCTWSDGQSRRIRADAETLSREGKEG
jgi:hypothetical protein